MTKSEALIQEAEASMLAIIRMARKPVVRAKGLLIIEGFKAKAKEILARKKTS